MFREQRFDSDLIATFVFCSHTQAIPKANNLMMQTGETMAVFLLLLLLFLTSIFSLLVPASVCVGHRELKSERSLLRIEIDS